MSELEKTYTVKEVAAMTRKSVWTIYRRFHREPGIYVIPRPETMHKRRYRLLRIPRSVLQRLGLC